MSKTITFEGLEEIQESLDSLIDAETIRRALAKACAIVERSAKQKAPKGRTGELRNSITSKVDVMGEDVVGVVYTPLEYAPYIEFGTGLFAEEQGRTDVPWSYQDEQGNWHSTSGMPPRPFMRPALYENREEVKRVIREGLSND